MEDKFCIQNMNLYYGDFHALKEVSMNIPANEITAFIWAFRLRQIHIFKIAKPDE